MINIMKEGLNVQGFMVEANGGRFEEDDVLFPEREDLDDKADRLYRENVEAEINPVEEI